MNKQIQSVPLSHPLDLPVKDIVSGIRSGSFSAEAIVAESIHRAKTLNGSLNHFALIREQQAMEAARDADRAVASGEATGSLHGIPFAAKDLTPTAGDVTTLGSWTREQWVPTETALCIRRLQAAGAILIGKTTTPEFAFSSFTTSPRWGITRNPWNSERTSGGSSGGSAVAVATGAVPFAEGTDMGGSVRIPAAFCGVVGLKPSLGRIPMTILPSLFDNISHFGPLARTVGDATAFMEVAAGSSEEDIQSLPIDFKGSLAQAAELRGRRFAFSLDLGYYAIQPQVEAVIRQSIDQMRAMGAIVEEVQIPWTRAVNDEWFDLWCVFMSAFFGDELQRFRAQMDPAVVSMIERGHTMSATHYKRVEFLRTAMWRDMARLFERYEALLCPTCAITAPPVSENDDDYVQTLADGRFKGLDLTCPFNLLGQLPALSVPVGPAADGLPVGLQIVGRRFADEHVLSIGAALEALPGSLATTLRRPPA